ncbi:helix-turn-helix domain-containing protein [uncultured Roseibium sp.]|uniref:helix-turn-helix domain-containing protein n=1 Tax=uncultured Roseibium sp. TaxID=1936171 RepID=UPI0026213782|nr:helix-turn-helix domain-containing protein [uncultured Roseibium sp.]
MQTVEMLTKQVEDLTDQIEYLEAQLMDQSVHFPDNWILTPSERKVLRHLLKRRIASTESILACLYSARGGDEPEENIVKVHIYRLRRVLSVVGVEITTLHREGYTLTPEMKDKVYRLCAAYETNDDNADFALTFPSINRGETLDPAVLALRRAHPYGPPSDVYEPKDDTQRICARTTALEKLGMLAAQTVRPELFVQKRAGMPC